MLGELGLVVTQPSIHTLGPLPPVELVCASIMSLMLFRSGEVHGTAPSVIAMHDGCAWISRKPGTTVSVPRLTMSPVSGVGLSPAHVNSRFSSVNAETNSSSSRPVRTSRGHMCCRHAYAPSQP